MNILRLSTLSLALAIAVITLGYINPSFAGKQCNNDQNHPSCKDARGDADYTAALTVGGFKFDPVDVAPNKKGTSYHSNISLDMNRPGNVDDCINNGSTTTANECEAWDRVFRACTPPFYSC